MTFVEALQLATSTGVLGLGLGVLKLSLGVEKRLTRIETIQETR